LIDTVPGPGPKAAAWQPPSGPETKAADGRVWRRLVVPLAFSLIVLPAAGCHTVRKAKPKPPPVPNEALYERATDLLEGRKFEQARQALTEIGTREVLSPELDPPVKIAFADSYFYDAGVANTIEAQSRYTQFLTFYPSSPLAGYAQFQVAMCYFKQSPKPHHDQTFTRRAIDEFEKVRRVNPDGRFVLAAEAMRDRCMDKVATHDYQVGLFYFRRKAYAGVISRFKGLLENYPRYSGADGVYYYLGLALLRTGDDAEGRVYLEKVRRDYPSSKFASAAQQELVKPAKG